jgi:hypothetical protein
MSEKMLLVSDWAADPEEVAGAAARAVANGGFAEIGIVVPAWLHGIDWMGDPHASIPCAARHERLLAAACRARGLTVTTSEVGDPHPVTAVLDALSSERAERVLVALEPRRVPRPSWLGLEGRVRRACGLPVEVLPVRRHRSRREHHCLAEPSLAV